MLNPIALKNNIKTLLESLQKSEDKTASVAKLATDLANIIDAYVKSATITVTTTVVGTSPSGPVTGTGTGNGIIS